jgi:hypothetical protein
MKRVYIFIISFISLFLISLIVLGFMDFYEISFSFTPNSDLYIIFLITLGISIGGSILGFLIVFLIRIILGFFKPKFIRIADNLEQVISQKRIILPKLGMSSRKKHVVDRMEYIWEKGDMQYPLSELNFERFSGGKPHD